MKIEVSVDDLDAKQRLAAASMLAKDPGPWLLDVADQAGDILRRHYIGLDSSRPNKLGGKRGHFWSAIGRSVAKASLVSADTARVSITDPRARQKAEGGTITAKTTKFLAIPLTSKAYGIWPREWKSRHGSTLFMPGKSGRPFLAERQGKALRVQYLLRRSVTQKADPDFWPEQSEFTSAVLAYASASLARRLA